MINTKIHDLLFPNQPIPDHLIHDLECHIKTHHRYNLNEDFLKIRNDDLFHGHHMGKGIRFFHQFVHVFGHDLPT
jgi:hypothetical protein